MLRVVSPPAVPREVARGPICRRYTSCGNGGSQGSFCWGKLFIRLSQLTFFRVALCPKNLVSLKARQVSCGLPGVEMGADAANDGMVAL